MDYVEKNDRLTPWKSAVAANITMYMGVCAYVCRYVSKNMIKTKTGKL